MGIGVVRARSELGAAIRSGREGYGTGERRKKKCVEPVEI